MQDSDDRSRPPDKQISFCLSRQGLFNDLSQSFKFSRNIVDGVLRMMALFSTKPPGRDYPGGQAAQ